MHGKQEQRAEVPELSLGVKDSFPEYNLLT